MDGSFVLYSLFSWVFHSLFYDKYQYLICVGVLCCIVNYMHWVFSRLKYILKDYVININLIFITVQDFYGGKKIGSLVVRAKFSAQLNDIFFIENQFFLCR